MSAAFPAEAGCEIC